MSQYQTLNRDPHIVALNSNYVPAGNQAQERFVIEDGWVFREHHGKYVECICRSDEVAKLPGPLLPAVGGS